MTAEYLIAALCSNPEFLREGILDCFAALAMTEDEVAACFSK